MKSTRKSKLITAVTVMAMCIMTAVPVGAASNVVVYLPQNQLWTGAYSTSRSTAYSYVSAECNSVYPLSGSDNFTQIQVTVVSNNNTTILKGEVATLTEGQGMKSLTIKDGYLDLRTVYFKFRGNSSSAANAVVSYQGN